MRAQFLGVKMHGHGFFDLLDTTYSLLDGLQ